MADGVEFLDQPQPGDDGAPSTPGPRHVGPRGPRRRRGVVVIVVVGLVLAGLLVARAVASGGHGPVTALPTSTSAPTSSSSSFVRSPDGPTYPLADCDEQLTVTAPPRVGANRPVVTFVPQPSAIRSGPVRCESYPAQCPQADDGENACTSSTAVPDSVVTAVRTLFPAARLLDALTETVRENGALWFRYLHFAVPGGQLAVEIAQGHPDDQPQGAWRNGSAVFARAVFTRGQLHVLVSATSVGSTASLPLTQVDLATRTTALTAR